MDISVNTNVYVAFDCDVCGTRVSYTESMDGECNKLSTEWEPVCTSCGMEFTAFEIIVDSSLESSWNFEKLECKMTNIKVTIICPACGVRRIIEIVRDLDHIVLIPAETCGCFETVIPQVTIDGSDQ